jgi:hypothetical protein
LSIRNKIMRCKYAIALLVLAVVITYILLELIKVEAWVVWAINAIVAKIIAILYVYS